MPKGKRKGKSGGKYPQHRNGRFDDSHSDDDSTNENQSVISNYSENCDWYAGEDAGGPEADAGSVSLVQDQFEDKLCELIDGMTQKSAQGRTNCFQSFGKALAKKYMPAFVRDRLFTLCDSIEKSLKKGGGEEKAAAADLAILLCIQLGDESVCENIGQSLKPVLLVIANDNSVAPLVRAKCCEALSNMSFLCGGELGDILLLMQQMETLFSGSYLKGDGSIPNITPELATLHATALSSWTLLLTLMAPNNVTSMMGTNNLPTLDQLSELLDSPHLDVRMAAGEALAMIFELGRLEIENFADDVALELTDSLKRLATDSHKYRAKKDRKQQRATFRDILQFIENDTIAEVQVKFAKEVLILDTWTKRRQYDAICSILGSGMNIHLSENELLRDIFQMVSPINSQDLNNRNQSQLEKNQRKSLNAANFKARTLSRAKNRDKRSDF